MERNYASGDMDDVAVPRFDAFGARGDLRLQEGVMAEMSAKFRALGRGETERRLSGS
jgi:hypothetical protein